MLTYIGIAFEATSDRAVAANYLASQLAGTGSSFWWGMHGITWYDADGNMQGWRYAEYLAIADYLSA